MRLKCGLLPVFLLLLTACDQSPMVHSLSGPTMGTVWSVTFVADSSSNSEIAGLREDIENALERVNAQMSTYREDSHITRFNRAGAGESITLPVEFADVLQVALALAEETDGVFDPTVGPLVNLWGFGPNGDRTQTPAKAEIQAALARVGWRQLVLDMSTRSLTQPGGVFLDLSAIAKGYGVDLVADALEQRGITAYLVDIGGDMRARGRKPDGLGWRIGVERPTPGERGIHSVIKPGDMAVATSGSYRNYFQDGEQEFSHTIDPRTGYPIPQDLVSVTVLHDTGMQADALATAIMALGPEAGYAFARDRELAVLLLLLDNGAVRERMTPAFALFVDGVAE